MNHNNNSKGFTLIELMVAVAIIGILAAIAVPNYSDYVTRSNRSEAQMELVRLANLQEQYYIDQRRYATDLTSLGLNANPYTTESGYYSISVSNTTGSFTLVARAVGSQLARDGLCSQFTITDTGRRNASDPSCWNK